MANKFESMTGFGEATAVVDGQSFVCKMKSVNHRFLDLKVRLPKPELHSLDSQLRKLASEYFKRGAVEISVSFDAKNAASVEKSRPAFDSELAMFYAEKCLEIEKLVQTRFKAGLAPVSSDQILKMPGVLDNSERAQGFEWNEKNETRILELVVKPALQLLKKSRLLEGENTKKHLNEMLTEIENHLNAIIALEPAEREKALKTFIERTEKTFDSIGAHWVLKFKDSEQKQLTLTKEFETRLREEASLWVEKRDFSEERVRLSNHLVRFHELIDTAPVTVGRQLEFLHQEALREINTLGNKAQSIEVSRHVVEVKSWIERIREQLANVE